MLLEQVVQILDKNLLKQQCYLFYLLLSEIFVKGLDLRDSKKKRDSVVIIIVEPYNNKPKSKIIIISGKAILYPYKIPIRYKSIILEKNDFHFWVITTLRGSTRISTTESTVFFLFLSIKK